MKVYCVFRELIMEDGVYYELEKVFLNINDAWNYRTDAREIDGAYRYVESRPIEQEKTYGAE